MREHQIAISLKPQQFELLQRLARERGFKSVTAYVKQKIVELALGLDSDDNTANENGYGFSGGEFPQLLGELGRIHDELRAFISPSLQAEIDSGTKIAASAQGFDPLPPGISQTSPYTPSSSSPASLLQEGAVSPVSAAAGPAPTNPVETKVPVSNQVLPSNKNLGGFGFRLGGFNLAKQAAQYQPPVENADKLSGYKEVMDDLEELADRAFAISPRLGALDETAPADTATGRGGRNNNETILVEPILPNKTVKPKEPPISMVPPITPANLPGPDQIQQNVSAVPGANLAPAPGLLATPAPIVAPAQISTTAAASEAAQEQAGLPTPPSRNPEVAQLLPPDTNNVAQTAVTDTVPASVPVVQAPAPLPGDDLLSELLDENLVAHAVAPRTQENPFAVDLGFVRPVEASDAVEERIDNDLVDQSTEGQDSGEPEDQPFTTDLEDIPSPAPVEEVEDLAEAHTAPTVSPQVLVSEEQKAQKDDRQDQSQSGSYASPAGESDQAASSPRISNISGGPPPRRRRT